MPINRSSKNKSWGGTIVIRGIYSAATGMNAGMERQDVIANNLANVDTVGFKQDNVSLRSFGEMLLQEFSRYENYPVGKMGIGVQTIGRYADLSNGSLQETGNPCHLAIQGDGVFAVETANGVRYTRAGNFTLDATGYLVTQDGLKVLGQKGPLKLEGDFSISALGEVIQNGEVKDYLQVFAQNGMEKEGHYLLRGQATPLIKGYQIMQGTLERSNVNAIREMINMITVSRYYESNQKLLTAQDESLGKAVNELAR